jgi:hypothetical protein
MSPDRFRWHTVGMCLRCEDIPHSLGALIVYRVSQTLAGNWTVALPVAAVIGAVCLVTIPFRHHLGMAGGGASTLSFAFLLLLIGISDAMIGESAPVCQMSVVS